MLRGLRRGIGLYIDEVSFPAYRRAVMRLANRVSLMIDLLVAYSTLLHLAFTSYIRVCHLNINIVFIYPFSYTDRMNLECYRPFEFSFSTFQIIPLYSAGRAISGAVGLVIVVWSKHAFQVQSPIPPHLFEIISNSRISRRVFQIFQVKIFAVVFPNDLSQLIIYARLDLCP